MASSNHDRLIDLPEEELNEAMERTAYFAFQRMKGRHWKGVIDGSVPQAKSAEDLAHEALEAVIDGAKWDSSKPLWLVMRGIVKGKVNHLAESLENRSLRDSEQHDEFIDTAQNRAGALACAPHDDAADDEVSERFLLGLIDVLDGDEEAQQVVEAIWEGERKRTEIANTTGLSVDQVTNARKRLQRILPDYRGKFLVETGIQ